MSRTYRIEAKWATSLRGEREMEVAIRAHQQQRAELDASYAADCAEYDEYMKESWRLLDLAREIYG